MELRKGQKISLDENFFTVKFERENSPLEIDTAAFLQEYGGKVGGDEDFIFYGNTSHNSESVSHLSDDSLKIDLSKVPKRIEKISFTATIYDAEIRKQNFGQLGRAVLRIKNAQGEEVANFPLENFSVENAIVLGEFYKYKNSWKFNAVGAGFSGGLAALCKNFGIEVTDEMTAPPPQEKIEPPKSKKFSSENTSAPKKIEIRKGQKVKITKNKNGLGEIVINLNWSQPSQSGFFSQFLNRGIDLDLACLYELKSGEIGAVQALGNLFGDLNSPPYIALDGDDRTGNNAGGETIRVNGKFINKIERILIFTFIYSGAANWEEAKGIVTVKCPGNPDLIVRMDDYGSKKPTCAIALLENVGGTFSVEKIVNFYYDSQQMDEDFDWGLNWTVGRKD
ncbi:MAG: TerD domain-containing protein [Selenomonadaceae bacterium]|nr:TerD domain-containing protein [Selenomonadaceae bacterium]